MSIFCLLAISTSGKILATVVIVAGILLLLGSLERGPSPQRERLIKDCWSTDHFKKDDEPPLSI